MVVIDCYACLFTVVGWLQVSLSPESFQMVLEPGWIFSDLGFVQNLNLWSSYYKVWVFTCSKFESWVSSCNLCFENLLWALCVWFAMEEGKLKIEKFDGKNFRF